MFGDRVCLASDQHTQHAVALESQRHDEAIVVLAQRGRRRVVLDNQLAHRLLFLAGDRAHGRVLVGRPLGRQRLAVLLRGDQRGLFFGAILFGQAVAVGQQSEHALFAFGDGARVLGVGGGARELERGGALLGGGGGETRVLDQLVRLGVGMEVGVEVD